MVHSIDHTTHSFSVSASFQFTVRLPTSSDNTAEVLNLLKEDMFVMIRSNLSHVHRRNHVLGSLS